MQCKTLEEVRSNIDRIDDEIIKLIAERGTYVVQASNFKKSEDGVKDNARVEKILLGGMLNLILRRGAMKYGVSIKQCSSMGKKYGRIQNHVSLE